MSDDFGPRDPNADDFQGEVLTLLSDERVFAIQRHGHGFHVYERCDQYFGVTLTRDQLIKLASELLEIAVGGPDTTTPGHRWEMIGSALVRGFGPEGVQPQKLLETGTVVQVVRREK